MFLDEKKNKQDSDMEFPSMTVNVFLLVVDGYILDTQDAWIQTIHCKTFHVSLEGIPGDEALATQSTLTSNVPSMNLHVSLQVVFGEKFLVTLSTGI